EVEREVVADGLPAWVVRLVSALHARRAVLITFNYDRIIERALMELDLHDFDQPSGDHLVSWIDMFGDVPSYPPIPMRFSGGLKPTIRLLKLHGSLNWYWVPGDSSGATLHHWELDDDTEGRARYLPRSRAVRRTARRDQVSLLPEPNHGRDVEASGRSASSR
ncbi:MAG TPA: hypothetical protein PLV68_19970, partial [Ilumatobacteraceae bacterium]|nr:hypothetical protein [Ilumatobacteraceae bacterium]